MKRILLTTTALVALAGAASAQNLAVAPMADGTIAPSDTPMMDLTPTAAESASGVVLGADGEFGYNDEVEGGFYFEGGLGVTTSAGMNMGLTAGLTLDIDLDFSDNETFNDDGIVVGSKTGIDGGTFDNINISASDFVVFVEGQGAALYIGDTETGAATRWAGTTNMEQDGFLEQDDIDDGAANGDFVDGVIRGDLDYGSVVASLSFLLANNTDTDDTDFDGLTGLSLGAEGTFGNFVVGMAYQEEISQSLVNFNRADDNEDGILTDEEAGNDDPGTVDEVVGVYAGSTFAGADVKVAYARNMTSEEDSIGVQVDYPFGPITATAFYSAESATEDNYGVGVSYENGPVAAAAYYHDGNDQEIGVEGSYDAGMGLTGYAGYIQNDGDSDAYEAYVAATYDLGGGASLIAAYGDTGDTYTGANDEIGNSFEVNEGTTIAVSFTF
ncbi:porin [Loktanella sp. DJP18]|uniref:porin n=1 Tax=Loktanella sp. DJP18 TaxID=3409788 RepID=UPI003BB6C588